VKTRSETGNAAQRLSLLLSSLKNVLMSRKFSLALLVGVSVIVLMAVVPAKHHDAHADNTYRAPAQINNFRIAVAPAFLSDTSSRWVDSVFNALTPEERIGQLFMVAAWSNKDKKHETEISELIKNQKVGGLIFMQGGPIRQANLTNRYQRESKVPLLIGMDAEWGPVMRIDSCINFPHQMQLGAMDDDSLVYWYGVEMARQCSLLGVHVSFSPVADVNNNPNNPVIGTRAFGENKYDVAEKAIMYSNGLQDNHVLACGKHFPGHGDTDSDSHKTLPVIKATRQRLDSLELYPFRELIASGVGSMMVAHLSIPALDTTANQATTLSRYVVDTLLKREMNFKGLVFTDALNMKGVSKYYGPGDLDVKALVAGNDVILFSGDVPKAVTLVQEAIKKGEITQAEIDLRCKKILATKKWVGLDKRKKLQTKGLYESLNDRNPQWLCRRIGEASMTLLNNKNSLVPLMNFEAHSIATLSVGHTVNNLFQERSSYYAPVTPYAVPYDAKKDTLDSLTTRLLRHDVIVLAIHKVSQRPANSYGGLSDVPDKLIDTLLKQNKKIVAVMFGSPYALNEIKRIEECDVVIQAYEDQAYMEDLAAQAVFGGIECRGNIPVTLNGWKAQTGITTTASRLHYTLPEEVGYDLKSLARIDSIINKGIADKCYPGCQVFAAKDGKVFLMKSYGHFTYDKKHVVNNKDLYDVASVTKIMSSAPCLMQMVDDGRLSLSDSLGEHLPAVKGSNKENMVIRDMMTHTAGLPAWIPFYERTLDAAGNWDKNVYSKTRTDSFPYYVAPNMWIQAHYRDTIYKRINNCKLNDDKKYLYSDLGYYYVKQIVEEKNSMLQSEYVMKQFYRPLGLTTMGYQPRLRFASARCAPTENDTKWRKQQLQGDVHDQGAAMLGGVGGHAGVFSNANDVGVMMQLFLNGGTYGGKRYFQSKTVNDFTGYAMKDCRRGICFDKPDPDPKKSDAASDSISCASFGHQGFTGTQAWADPETGLVFVFLSNRVYPDTEPNKLAKEGIRGKVMQELVMGIKNSKIP
jgi:beta-glucosidase-like glycosyl hydrolase/CubicO group peptidase (beta-lactamase class C family)